MGIFRLAAGFGAVAAMLGCTSDVDGGLAGADGGGLGGESGISQEALNSQFEPDSPEFFEIEVGDKVYFAVDQSAITADSAEVLDGQAEWLLRNPGFEILVEGHADEQGTREYNLALGARRASAVRDYLHNRGVPDSRIRTVTYGKERPVAVCSDETCWSQNRRGVTVLSPPVGA